MHAVRPLRHHVAVGLRHRQLRVNGLLPLLAGRYEVRQREIGVRTRHEVGMMVSDERVLHALGHAPQHSEDAVSAVHVLAVQRLKAVIYLLLGIVAHGAGIEKHRIGTVNVVCQFIASHLHDACHHFAVGYIHLAAVCLYM